MNRPSLFPASTLVFCGGLPAMSKELLTPSLLQKEETPVGRPHPSGGETDLPTAEGECSFSSCQSVAHASHRLDHSPGRHKGAGLCGFIPLHIIETFCSMH